MKISSKDSKVEIYVIPTNEELILARDTVRVVLDAPRVY
jgi:acetate kinase